MKKNWKNEPGIPDDAGIFLRSHFLSTCDPNIGGGFMKRAWLSATSWLQVFCTKRRSKSDLMTIKCYKSLLFVCISSLHAPQGQRSDKSHLLLFHHLVHVVLLLLLSLLHFLLMLLLIAEWPGGRAQQGGAMRNLPTTRNISLCPYQCFALPILRQQSRAVEWHQSGRHWVLCPYASSALWLHNPTDGEKQHTRGGPEGRGDCRRCGNLCSHNPQPNYQAQSVTSPGFNSGVCKQLRASRIFFRWRSFSEFSYLSRSKCNKRVWIYEYVQLQVSLSTTPA